MYKSLLTFFLFSPLFTLGQNTKTDSVETAVTNIVTEKKVGELLDRHIKINKKRKGILGWRLQIHSDTEREKAKKVKEIIIESGINIDFEIDGIKNDVKVSFKNLSKSGKIVNAYNALILASRSKRK